MAKQAVCTSVSAHLRVVEQVLALVKKNCAASVRSLECADDCCVRKQVCRPVEFRERCIFGQKDYVGAALRF